MSASYGIVLPLWTYAADQGSLLERVAGEVGIDHVTVLAITGPQTQFSLNCDPDAPQFHTEGGWHFPPGPRAHLSPGIRPAKARWYGSSDALARLRDRVRQLGARLIVRLDLRGVPALVEQSPHLAQRNAWGQEVPAAGPCACHADLRELLRATLDDLRRYESAGHELANWVPDDPINRGTPRPLDWNPDVRELLDICFCPSCRQVAERAGVDPDQAARSVRVEVERCLGGSPQIVPPPANPKSKIQNPKSPPDEGDAVLAAYVLARVADCRRCLARLAETDAARQHLLLYEYGQPAPYGDDPPWRRVVRLGQAVATRSALREGGASDDLSDVIAAGTQAGGLALGAWRPTFSEPAQLVRLVCDATKAGVGFFDFEGLDESPPDAVTWLKQAVRFARRG